MSYWIERQISLTDESGGFIFDANRRSLAYSNKGLLIQTDAGVHPINGFKDFDPGPNSAAMRGGNGALVGEGEAKGIYLKIDSIFGGGNWFVRVLGKWNPHKGDPAHDRICVKNPTWQWKLQNNKMEVALNGVQTFNFGHQANRRLALLDILKDATVHKGRLYVMTEAFSRAV